MSGSRAEALPAGLHSESIAMLDMLVLEEADLFAGISVSTFSWYLRERRCLRV